jgi:peroxiredoxin
MAKVALNVPAPDFTLTDFNGETVSLSAFRGKKHLFLVFNRGFHVTILPRAHGAVASRL